MQPLQKVPKARTKVVAKAAFSIGICPDLYYNGYEKSSGKTPHNSGRCCRK